MLGRTLLRTVLLLWLAGLSLQGGTGFKPPGGSVGGVLTQSKGYDLRSKVPRAYPPRVKGLGHGAPPLQSTGHGAPPPQSPGYGAQAAGNGGKPNGSGKMFSKGFGSAPATVRNGVKGNGNTAPSAVIGNGGGYGSKPNKPGYGGWPSYGGMGTGLGMVPQLATKQRGGLANGYGYRTPSFGGYRTGQAAYAPAGAGLGGGYTNGAKPAKPGYGAGLGAQKGQGAKPKGYGTGVSTLNAQGAKPTGYGSSAPANKGPRPGYGGYANPGGFKGPKAGYGGGYGRVPTGYGPRPNGYGAYLSAGAKAPKPGFGAAAGTGANAGAGAKANGYGYVTQGNEKGPKGMSLGPETQRLPSAYTKGVASLAETFPTARVPPAARPTPALPSLLTNEKGLKPQTWAAELAMRDRAPAAPQGKPAKPAVPGLLPQPLVPGLAQVLPQSKALKLASPVLPLPQGQVPIPVVLDTAGLVPSRSAQAAPAQLPFVPQRKAPKPVLQPLQSAATAPQVPASLQRKAPKPYVPAPVPVLPQATLARPTLPMPLAGGPPSKGLKPAVPEAWTQAPPVPPEPALPLAQVDGLKVANPDLMGVMQPNKGGTKPAQTDCAHGVSGQWTKLPSPGFGPAPWYPNSGGAKASKAGYGGYGAKPKQIGYINGEGLPPGPGYGNVQAAVAEPIKVNGYQSSLGTSQIEPQTAELGPGAKSPGPFGLPYGAQPVGLGSEGSPQIQYAGIGGLPFAGSPVGYSPDPYGKYGSPYGAQPYASKPAGNYGGPFGSKPRGLDLPPQAAGKYGIGGLKYGGHGGEATPSGTYGPGFRGLPYGASLGPDPGNTGKYGQPALPYGPESMSLGSDAKSAAKYGNPAFDALGPVTDGKSINQPVLPYEPLSLGPQIDGVMSVDQFGEGEVPPQPNMGVVEGQGKVKSTDKYGTGAIEGIQAEGAKENKYNLKGFFGNGYQG